MNDKSLFSKKMNLLLRKLFHGNLSQMSVITNFSDKALQNYLEEKKEKKSKYPTRTFLNRVQDTKKGQFFIEQNLLPIDFMDHTTLADFRKKIDDLRDIYFDIKNLSGEYLVCLNIHNKQKLTIEKYTNDKFYATFKYKDSTMKSKEFLVYYHQILITFHRNNNEIIILSLYKPSGNKPILLGTLQYLDQNTYLPSINKVHVIKSSELINKWEFLLDNSIESISFSTPDTMLVNNDEERLQYILNKLADRFNILTKDLMHYRNLLQKYGRNFYYTYLIDYLNNILQNKQSAYFRGQTYFMYGNVDAGKRFFNHVDEYLDRNSISSTDITCYLMTTPTDNFESSIYSRTYPLRRQEYQEYVLRLAKKSKIMRIFILNKGTQLRSISDLLMEQYLNGIDVYISNGSESSGYTEVAFTSLKKHFIYMKKKSPDSVSYVSKDPNEIDRLHNTFLRIIEGNNCKPIQHFIQTDKQGKLMQDVDGLYKINPGIRNKFWIN